MSSIDIREYTQKDLAGMTNLWNAVVMEGNAFPQKEPFSAGEAETFFQKQSFTGVAKKDGEIVGLYILHPNNVGRCAHIANASYAVKQSDRGEHIGEKLVEHCMRQGKLLGFRILQFNAVVRTNRSAVHLYEKLGFVSLGCIPEGFQKKDGTFEDIILFYHTL